jgi:hypothetical protein
MRIVKFYGHFAAAFGSLWLGLFLIAFVTQARINLGLVGAAAVLIVCAIYAHQRLKGNKFLENLIGEIGQWLDRMCVRFGLFGHSKRL